MKALQMTAMRRRSFIADVSPLDDEDEGRKNTRVAVDPLYQRLPIHSLGRWEWPAEPRPLYAKKKQKAGRAPPYPEKSRE